MVIKIYCLKGAYRTVECDSWKIELDGAPRLLCFNGIRIVAEYMLNNIIGFEVEQEGANERTK